MMRRRRSKNHQQEGAPHYPESVDYEEVDLHFRSKLNSMVPSQMAERIQRILAKRAQRKEELDDAEAI